ncbi:MAG: tetratricopeptide repeat protein [Desulfobulbaceae bacterium]|nr:tetratricopeptide repeat protein [Desulfobulbaceae bacterium]
MPNSTSPTGKGSPIFIWVIIFLCGFVAGVGFAVYKLRPADAPSEQRVEAHRQENDERTKAIQRLEAEVTAKPDNYESWLHLGHLYYDAGQAEKAIRAYTKSLSLRDGDANLYTDLGTMYRAVGQAEQALASFDKARSLDARHQQCRFNKGVVLFEMNRPDEALTVWRELTAINPDAQTPDGRKVADLINELAAKKE